MAGARVIISFRENDRPAPGSDALQRRLDAIAASSGLERLAWRRRLATGADLAMAAGPLDATGMARLLEHARARGDVEYAEADAMATIAGGRMADG